MPKLVNRFFHRLKKIWPLSLTLTRTLKKEEGVLTEDMKRYGFTPARSGRLTLIQHRLEERGTRKEARKGWFGRFIGKLNRDIPENQKDKK